MPARLPPLRGSPVGPHFKRYGGGKTIPSRLSPDARVLVELEQACVQGAGMSDGVMQMQTIARTDVEDFLFAEAELLDEWRLPEWLELFTDDAIYYVPATDLAVDASPDNNLFYVADDRFRLSERVKRLMKRTAHAEFPHSRIRSLVSNGVIRKHVMK